MIMKIQVKKNIRRKAILKEIKRNIVQNLEI